MPPWSCASDRSWAGISSVDDMNMAVELGLDMRAPFGFMNKLGTAEALRLVEAYHAKYPDFPVPQLLKDKGASNEPFVIRSIMRTDREGVAVLKIRRPKVLNALNQEVFDEIRETFDALNEDPSIEVHRVFPFSLELEAEAMQQEHGVANLVEGPGVEHARVRERQHRIAVAAFVGEVGVVRRLDGLDLRRWGDLRLTGEEESGCEQGGKGPNPSSSNHPGSPCGLSRNGTITDRCRSASIGRVRHLCYRRAGGVALVGGVACLGGDGSRSARSCSLQN